MTLGGNGERVYGCASRSCLKNLVNGVLHARIRVLPDAANTLKRSRSIDSGKGCWFLWSCVTVPVMLPIPSLAVFGSSRAYTQGCVHEPTIPDPGMRAAWQNHSLSGAWTCTQRAAILSGWVSVSVCLQTALHSLEVLLSC